MKTMRVAVISNRNIPGFVTKNLADHVRWVREASVAGASLVLFPELSLSGYTTADFVQDIAMTLDDSPCQTLIQLAAECDLYIAFGLPLRHRNQLYISHAIVGPRGIVGHYEKVHLFGPANRNPGPPADVFDEVRVFNPGRSFRVFDVNGVKVGINICFDGRHPGSSLATAHLGAEVILHPHGNTMLDVLGNDPSDWARKKRTYLGPRAVDTCTYTLICNSVGDVRDLDDRLYRFCGGALVLGPTGEFVARSAFTLREPHMILVDLDIGDLRRQRKISHFASRQPAAYVDALRWRA